MRDDRDQNRRSYDRRKDHEVDEDRSLHRWTIRIHDITP
jgi:hypothetical protein